MAAIPAGQVLLVEGAGMIEPVPVATAFGGDAWPTYGELRGLLGVVAPIAQTSARWYVTWHEGWGVTARIR